MYMIETTLVQDFSPLKIEITRYHNVFNHVIYAWYFRDRLILLSVQNGVIRARTTRIPGALKEVHAIEELRYLLSLREMSVLLLQETCNHHAPCLLNQDQKPQIQSCTKLALRIVLPMEIALKHMIIIHFLMVVGPIREMGP